MILTVTLNPLLERRLSYKKIIHAAENRNGKTELRAGGKGINVSRQLNKFNVENIAFTFTGGNTGKIFNEVMHHEKIKTLAVRTKNETRNAIVIIDESQEQVTTFFEPSPEISPVEADEFLSRLEKLISNCETVVLSGSSPGKVCDHIFPAAIEIANKLDKISLCDTYGGHLKNCIDAAPTIIHNNVSEISNSLNIELNDQKDKIEFMKSLYSKNITQVYLTDGGNPFYASNFDYHFRIVIPQIITKDSTGSGDAFSAGIIYNWKNNLSFEEGLSFAAACGALNAASFETCNVNPDDILKIKKEVLISPIGKQMKYVDVTPH